MVKSGGSGAEAKVPCLPSKTLLTEYFVDQDLPIAGKQDRNRIRLEKSPCRDMGAQTEQPFPLDAGGSKIDTCSII